MQNIHSSAMLIDLRISQWTARKIDKKVTEEVATKHGVRTGVGTYYKSVLPAGNVNERTVLEEIKLLVTQARTYHYKMTLPWLDSGPRVLSNPMYFEYMQEMQTFSGKFEALVNAFVHDYPLARQEAMRTLGSMFNEDDYPDTHNIAKRFTFSVNVLPIPIGTDFRCDIGEAEVSRIRSEIDASTQAMTRGLVTELVKRMIDVTERYVDRLQFEDTKFQASMVDGAKEVSRILASFDIGDDGTLAKLADDFEARLCGYGPDDLRNNMSARRETYEAAIEMKKDLAAFFGVQS